MGIGVDAFQANGFPALRLCFGFRISDFGFSNLSLLTSAATQIRRLGRVLARAIPNHRSSVFVRIDLVEVNFRLRHSFGPRRISFWPRRLVVNLRDRCAMVEPILFVGRTVLGDAGIGARETFDDVHHSFGRRLQQHFLFAGLQVDRHEIPGGDHAAGDISMRIIHTQHVTAPGAVGMLWADSAEVLDDLARLRIVNVKPDLIAPSARAVNPAIGSDRERTNFAAESLNDLSPFLQ